MARRPDRSFPWQSQAPVYGTAFFTGNLFPMSHVVMPLWALDLGASPIMVGILVASRQVLPVLLSIHGGVLLDRFGPRNVIMLFGAVGTVATVFFPVLPFLWVAIILQMIVGFSETTSWIGAQAAVGKTLEGRAVFAGRMTAAARAGGFLGPWLVGVAWVHWGAFGGFLFFACWSMGGVVASSFLPRVTNLTAAPKPGRGSDIMPRVSDYRETLRMLALTAIALVIAATFLRQTASGIQASFYAVWLREIGLTADRIGLLVGIGNVVSALTALSIGPLTRCIADYWLLIVAVAAAIVGITVTPLIEGFVLLAVAMGVRGAGQGLNLPLMMLIAARTVAPRLLGRVTALRVSFNRLGNVVFPVVMGGLAELIGLANAFYTVGGAGVLLLCVLSVWVLRTRDRLGGR